MNAKFFPLIFVVFFFISCNQKMDTNNNIVSENIDFAVAQLGRQVEIIENSCKFLNPRTVKSDQIYYVGTEDWTSGFFPGSMWYMYELTGDKKWEELGIRYTERLDSSKYLTSHHDIGFIINCSFGNAYRITRNDKYKDVIIEAARSLSTRYRQTPGIIQSWDVNNGWITKRGWMCPVIIDNMMNLELLFEATRFSGDSSFYKIAVSHADVTLANHFRDDYSCYHVVDYDLIKGGVRNKHTAQGYAHESAWARGQAWAIYGYTMCYRETKDIRYLEIASKIYNFLFKHKNMPDDLIPYWDFDAPHIPNEPRDASSAAIIASALYELSTYGKPEYKDTADQIITSLSSPAYRAIVGTNHNFLLMHSVGSIPHGHEIDVPINYADYYFLEALARKRKLEM
jgi:rhamnogalacturonyl hydrolase YesR